MNVNYKIYCPIEIIFLSSIRIPKLYIFTQYSYIFSKGVHILIKIIYIHI